MKQLQKCPGKGEEECGRKKKKCDAGKKKGKEGGHNPTRSLFIPDSSCLPPSTS